MGLSSGTVHWLAEQVPVLREQPVQKEHSGICVCALVKGVTLTLLWLW